MKTFAAILLMLINSVKFLFLPAAIILLIMKRWEMAIIFGVIWVIAFLISKSLNKN